MRLEPFVPSLITEGRLRVDFATGQIFSTRSNTPNKPLGALTPKGYLRICITINGRQTHALAHRIIWIAKHGPIPDRAQIDHIDTVKTNNRISNLEAVSGAENMARAAKNGLAKGGRRNALRDPQTGRFIGKHLAGRLLDGREWNEFPLEASYV